MAEAEQINVYYISPIPGWGDTMRYVTDGKGFAIVPTSQAARAMMANQRRVCGDQSEEQCQAGIQRAVEEILNSKSYSLDNHPTDSSQQ